MNWNPIDFQGIISLDSPIIELLNQYLDVKEAELAADIIAAIPPSKADSSKVPTLPSPDVPLKLSHAIEIFSKHNYQFNEYTEPLVSQSDYEKSVKQIHDALWQYIEMLEGCVQELFHQLDQLGLEQWHVRLSNVVGGIKDILIHKIEDLIWSVRRLEVLLTKCRKASASKQPLMAIKEKIASLWKPPLDRSLVTQLRLIEEDLRSNYSKFIRRYRGFLQLQDQVDKSLQKLTHYQVLGSLERGTQLNFIKLYQLLKLWEINRDTHTLPKQEFVMALRNAMSFDKTLGVFKEYYQELRRQLFDKSLYFKRNPQELTESSEAVKHMQEVLAGYQKEAHLLEATITHFREFLLRADPDPYVRSRLNSSDLFIGPEPLQTKSLLRLRDEVESLNHHFLQLSQGLNKSPDDQIRNRRRLDYQIQNLLQEMGHPLASKQLLHNTAEQLLEKLQEVDEIGSLDSNAVEYVNQVLTQLLRLDWKYHVCFAFPQFHQIYHIHKGLMKPIKHRHLASRVQKFHIWISQILEWVSSKKTQEHSHEIELDMNDIRGYLQDFLGYVQRNLSDNNMTRMKAQMLQADLAQELLECRYLFGNFFYRLQQYPPEGPLLRRQLLFVDHYLESIDQRLQEMGNASWPETVEPTAEEPSSEEEGD